jgi:CO/xanthine dehydrogenase Mo-binding subunit
MLKGSAALVVSFSLFDLRKLSAQQVPAHAKLPGSLDDEPMLDAWIRIDAQGKITLFTGKAELGQGVKTSLVQVAAEELAVAAHSVELITADTQRTPDEGYTAGSHSMQDSGTALLNAAAQVREILLSTAAAKWSLPKQRLTADNGFVVSDDGKRIGYGDLVTDELLHTQATVESKLTDPRKYRLIGQSLPRFDIPAKVTGGVAYVHDMRMPGMAHARVVRPPSYSARLREVKTDDVEKLPGVVKIVRNGNYLAVVAEREYQAVMAMYALEQAATWEESATLPEPAELFSFLDKQPAQTTTILDRHGPADAPTRQLEASYRRSYQMHGAIGPACAVALFKDGAVTVWTHSQGVYPLRSAVAKMLALPEDHVHCIHREGSGCYGHNAADDAAADACLIARALPGRHVRVQWMREQEHTWEPFGAAMITKVRASLDRKGNIASWEYEVRSNTHSTRPNRGGNLMPSWHLDPPQARPPPRALPLPDGGGDRNAIPWYNFANARVDHHFVTNTPLRVSALRSLGAYANIFSIESFMDELATLANIDPVEFRLRHLDDDRAKEVIRTAAQKFGWSKRPKASGRGCGLAFARYKNQGGYAAIAIEVSVDKQTGQIQILRAVAAFDGGQAINPDGIRNQIEGGIVQSSSWTLHEAVTFDRTRITSRDWSGYPIMRFSSVPHSIEVHIIDRPGMPFLGAGEVAQAPTPAAIANAVAAATGRRLRELPLRLEPGAAGKE